MVRDKRPRVWLVEVPLAGAYVVAGCYSNRNAARRKRRELLKSKRHAVVVGYLIDRDEHDKGWAAPDTGDNDGVTGRLVYDDREEVLQG